MCVINKIKIQYFCSKKLVTKNLTCGNQYMWFIILTLIINLQIKTD